MRRAIWLLDKALNVAVACILFLSLVMGCYALWDSRVMESQAAPAQWTAYRPEPESTLGFDDLRAMNADVCGWLQVFGTKIDYPLVQGGDNTRYLSCDAQGSYSLSGALYLDHANARDFADFNTIVYGHHMEGGVMFGSLGEFAHADFFDAHRFGTLFDGQRLWGLEFFAYLDADAYDASVYNPGVQTPQAQAAYLDALLAHAALTCDVPVSPEADERIVLLSTCASGETNARSIVVGKLTSEVPENPFAEEARTGTGIEKLTGLFGFPWIGWLCILVLAVLLAAALLLALAKRRTRAERKGMLPPRG